MIKEELTYVDKDFGSFKILYDRKKKYSECCLFASHTILPFIPEYVYHYLHDIKESGIGLFFVSSSELSETDIKRLSSIVDLIIVKENKGTDFGGWCAALRYIGLTTEFDTLFLCNDSVFGPFVPFATMYDAFKKSDAQVFGLTDSNQRQYHIQSYFLGFKKAVLLSNTWRSFWEDMSFQMEKTKVIELYEIGLTNILFQGNFKFFIWSEWKKNIGYTGLLAKLEDSTQFREKWLFRALEEKELILEDINPSSFFWKELIQKSKHPFIKREIFVFKHLHDEAEVENYWEKVLRANSNYPIELIRSFIFQFFFFKSWNNFLETNKDLEIFTIVSPDIDSSHEPVPLSDLTTVLGRIFPPIQWNNFPARHKGNCILLEGHNVKILSLLVVNKVTGQENIFSFVRLPDNIIDYDSSKLLQIKRWIAGLTNCIVITSNDVLKEVALKFFNVKYEYLVSENDLLKPCNADILINFIAKVINKGPLFGQAILTRPSLSFIVEEAKNQVANSSFLNEVMDPINNEIGSHMFGTSEFESFLRIKEHYKFIYEDTPEWFKKIGQIIKLCLGKKRIVFDIKDRNLKPNYQTNAEDIRHWYQIQYEVLPDWYKKIGRKLIKDYEKG